MTMINQLSEHMAMTVAEGVISRKSNGYTGESQVPAYSAIMRGEKSMLENGISTVESLDGLNLKTVQDFMESIYNKSVSGMKAYAQYFKAGAYALTVNGAMDSDVNNWNIDWVALVGFNISHPRLIEGETAEFDNIACCWVTQSGDTYDFDTETGLPTTQIKDAI